MPFDGVHQTNKVIDDVRKLLRNGDGWIRYQLYGHDDAGMKRYCLVGALSQLINDDKSRETDVLKTATAMLSVIEKKRRENGCEVVAVSIEHFNDYAETFAEIDELLNTTEQQMLTERMVSEEEIA